MPLRKDPKDYNYIYKPMNKLTSSGVMVKGAVLPAFQVAHPYALSNSPLRLIKRLACCSIVEFLCSPAGKEDVLGNQDIQEA